MYRLVIIMYRLVTIMYRLVIIMYRLVTIMCRPADQTQRHVHAVFLGPRWLNCQLHVQHE